MLFLFSQPYLRSVPGLKKNLCCGDMTLIFLHTPSLQDCDETVLDKLDSLNDSEPKVRRFRAKPCCRLSSCEDYPLDECKCKCNLFVNVICNLFTHEAPKSLRARFSVSVRSRSNWNLEVLVFGERGKPEYPEKNLSEQGREPTTNSTHIWRRRRELTRVTLVGGERSHHCATLARFLMSARSFLNPVPFRH